MSSSEERGCPRIAYALQVHGKPNQVARLINRLSSPHSSFHVRVFMANAADHDHWLSKLSSGGQNVHVEFTDHGVWGSFGQVEATLDSMHYFQRRDYDYFINLSGQCYPLVSTMKILDFFKGNDKGYIEYRSMPAKGWKRGGMNRIHNRYYRISEKRFIPIPRINKKIPGDMIPFGGSSWFCLHKKHIDYILNFVCDRPSFVDFFRRALCPDEIFFQTILANSPLAPTLVADNLRHIEWIDGRRPAYITSVDIERVLATGKLFGRKFDMEADDKVFDIIDRLAEQDIG